MVKINTGTKLALGFGMQIVFALLLGVAVFLGLSEVQRQFQFVVEHDAPVIANARHLLKQVVDMETGQRGFVITGKDEFLEPYYSGIEEFDTIVDLEKELVSDNPSQVAALNRVVDLVAEWKLKAAGPEIEMARRVAKNEIDATYIQNTLTEGAGKDLIDRFMVVGHEIETYFSSRKDWEGAFYVEVIEKCIADKEDGQRGFLITGKEDFLQKYNAGEQQKLPEYFARLRAHISQRELESELLHKVNKLESLAEKWHRKAAEPEIAARRIMNQQPETLKDVVALIQSGKGKALIDEIRMELKHFVEIEEGLTAERFTAAKRAATQAKAIATGLMLVAICAGIIIAVTTRGSITKPLAKLVQGTEKVGAGKLDTRVRMESADEIGALTSAFNSMVSQLETAETTRRELESNLAHAQKLESIGQLAAGIAHEINTPTQYVGDNTRFLQDSFNDVTPVLKQAGELAESIGTGNDSSKLAEKLKADLEELDIDYLTEEIPRAIDQSLSGIDRVRKIVQSMKEFSHPGADGMTAVDLNHCIESTITVAANEWRYVADMETDLDPELPHVECLPSEINQVILNMIVNAAHAIADVVTKGNAKGTIKVSTIHDGQFAEIRIADTGTGIPEEARGRIFDPFCTTKDVGKGTGQGLSIANGVVVKKHLGTLEFETEVGKGTTFYIRLPIRKITDKTPV